MTLRGRIKNGKILLEQPAPLPDGTQVEIRPIKTGGKTKTPKAAKKPRSLADRLRPFIGKVKGLPADASENIDHYLYGMPKRK